MAKLEKEQTTELNKNQAANVDAEVGSAADVDEIMRKYDRESNTRIWVGKPKIVVSIILALFSLFCIYTTLFANFLEQVRLTSFLGLIIIMGFLTYPAKKGKQKPNRIPWYDIVLMIVGAAAFFYYCFNAHAIVNMRLGVKLKDPMFTIIGVVGILVLAELCRRSVGLPILCVAGFFVAYTLISGTKLSRTAYELFFGENGVLSTPISVCSKYIVVFIIFGSFLERTGIADFFISLANSLCGRYAGGPAKVAVVSSALCGMVSGSSVGNTVTTGSITIPMMKKTGYRAEFAGAVEASASTGGQIMPPIMGAAAFLMAEYVGVPYSNIIVRAILPAVLYFLGIFIAVHFEAKKLGLKGISPEMLPRIKQLIKDTYLLAPLVVLIWLVCSNTKTMQFSAAIAIVTAIGVGFLNNFLRFCRKTKAEASTTGKVTKLTKGVLIIGLIFLVMSGACFAASKIVACVTASAAAESSVMAIPAIQYVSVYLIVFGVVAGVALLLLGAFAAYMNKYKIEGAKLTKATFGVGGGFGAKNIFEALESGGRGCISVGVACGIAGIIAGCLTITGLASKLINVIVGISQGFPLLALVLTMLCCIVLGMGVPTTANYCIMASTCAPILIKMGIPTIAAHFFVFYFGIVADITPPVALAAYAGSAIAKGNPMKTGVTATRLAIAAFIIPFIFAYSPSILFIGEGLVWYDIVLIVITSIIGMVGVASGLSGYLVKRMSVFDRILSIAGGLCLIIPGTVTDLIGIALIALSIVFQIYGKKIRKWGVPAIVVAGIGFVLLITGVFGFTLSAPVIPSIDGIVEAADQIVSNELQEADKALKADNAVETSDSIEAIDAAEAADVAEDAAEAEDTAVAEDSSFFTVLSNIIWSYNLVLTCAGAVLMAVGIVLGVIKSKKK